MICTISTYGYRHTANCQLSRRFLVLSGTLTMGRCRPTRMTPLIWGPQRSRNTKHVRFQNHYFSIFLLYDFCAWLKTWSFMIFLIEEPISQSPQCPFPRTWGSHSWHFWNGFLVQEWILASQHLRFPSGNSPWVSNESFWMMLGPNYLNKHIHICIPGIQF